MKVSLPNKNIVFFKPIPGPGEAMSREVGKSLTFTGHERFSVFRQSVDSRTSPSF